MCHVSPGQPQARDPERIGEESKDLKTMDSKDCGDGAERTNQIL